MKKDLFVSLSVLGIIGVSIVTIGAFSLSNNCIFKDDVKAGIQNPAFSTNVDTLNSEENKKGDSYVRSLNEAPDPYSADKSDVYHIILHTIDYFDKASGRLFACTTQDKIARMTDFNTCMSKPSAFNDKKVFKVDDISLMSEEYLSKCECVQTCKQYYTSDSCYEVDDLNKIYSEQQGYGMMPYSSFYPSDKQELINSFHDEDRVSIDENGDKHAAIMPDPTYVIDSSVFLFPQNYAMGFLSDFDLWAIDGVSEFDGRQCYNISGTAEKDYGIKLGVNHFNMCIDCKTGVILKYEGYDCYGQLKNYLFTENIKFDDEVEDTPRFDLKDVEGYK